MPIHPAKVTTNTRKMTRKVS